MSLGPLVLTPGEPAGIGPDLAVSLSQQRFDFGLVVIADPELLLDRSVRLQIPVNIVPYERDVPPRRQIPGSLTVLPIRLTAPVIPGHASSGNAAYVLSTIDQAVDGCLSGEFAAMVTGPVHKAVINEAGHRFSGHTEYIAGRCGNSLPVMMLMNQDLKIALVTTHLPLQDVPRTITSDLVEAVIGIVRQAMIDQFGIPRPRILVCGLNPHAGEQGYLGREEIDRISPAIRKLQQQGMDITGPLPADTAFTPDSRQQADVIVTMFHDQGLPVLKSLGFGGIVNITLGLPIIRTSVDHGTALELAGSGKARDSSLLAAVRCAASMSAQNNR